MSFLHFCGIMLPQMFNFRPQLFLSRKLCCILLIKQIFIDYSFYYLLHGSYHVYIVQSFLAHGYLFISFELIWIYKFFYFFLIYYYNKQNVKKTTLQFIIATLNNCFSTFIAMYLSCVMYLYLYLDYVKRILIALPCTVHSFFSPPTKNRKSKIKNQN